MPEKRVRGAQPETEAVASVPPVQPSLAKTASAGPAQESKKRPFHVCLSIGVNVHVSVDATSEDEAKAIARKLKVCGVEMFDPKTCDDAIVEFDETYEVLMGAAIDLGEIDKAVSKATA